MNVYTQLLSDFRNRLTADAYLAPIPILNEGEGRPLAVATRARAAGIVTLTFTAPHKIKSGALIRAEEFSDETFNAEKPEVTVVNPTTLTYANAGGDVAATAEAVGIITPLLIPIEEAIERGLAEGGLLRGKTSKSGLAISLSLIGRTPGDNNVPGARFVKIRATLFGNALQNAVGLKKPMLDVLAAIDDSISLWNRGDGLVTPEFAGGGRSNLGDEVAMFSDYTVFHLFT